MLPDKERPSGCCHLCLSLSSFLKYCLIFQPFQSTETFQRLGHSLTSHPRCPTAALSWTKNGRGAGTGAARRPRCYRTLGPESPLTATGVAWLSQVSSQAALKLHFPCFQPAPWALKTVLTLAAFCPFLP